LSYLKVSRAAGHNIKYKSNIMSTKEVMAMFFLSAVANFSSLGHLCGRAWIPAVGLDTRSDGRELQFTGDSYGGRRLDRIGLKRLWTET